MRVKNMSALALIVTAAGLSLTACGSSAGSSASAGTSAPTAAASSTGDQGSPSGSSSSGSSTGPGKVSERTTANAQSATSGSVCKTDNLALSAASTGVKNEIVVNLKNTGSSKCSMHGFPGVQLVGPDGLGDTGPDAARTDASASTVNIGPGEETRFLLRYIPDAGGSGKTYTRLSVTPPNETVSEIVNLNDLAITVAAPSGHAPDVYVDPVGYHVGSGK